MSRRFQFSLKALLVATALIGAGTMFAGVAAKRSNWDDIIFACIAASCFGSAVGAFAKNPILGIAVGIYAGPLLAVVSLLFMALMRPFID